MCLFLKYMDRFAPKRPFKHDRGAKQSPLGGWSEIKYRWLLARMGHVPGGIKSLITTHENISL